MARVRNIWLSPLGESFILAISLSVRKHIASETSEMVLKIRLLRTSSVLVTHMPVPNVVIVGQDFIARVDVPQTRITLREISAVFINTVVSYLKNV